MTNPTETRSITTPATQSVVTRWAERVRQWEQDGATSPSPRDMALDVLDATGAVPYSDEPDEGILDRLAELIDRWEQDGLTPTHTAGVAVRWVRDVITEAEAKPARFTVPRHEYTQAIGCIVHDTAPQYPDGITPGEAIAELENRKGITLPDDLKPSNVSTALVGLWRQGKVSRVAHKVTREGHNSNRRVWAYRPAGVAIAYDEWPRDAKPDDKPTASATSTAAPGVVWTIEDLTEPEWSDDMRTLKVIGTITVAVADWPEFLNRYGVR